MTDKISAAELAALATGILRFEPPKPFKRLVMSMSTAERLGVDFTSPNVHVWTEAEMQALEEDEACTT